MSAASRTDAAIEARRAATAAMIGRVDNVLSQMKRERIKVSFAAVSRRAAVSRTFLYQHPDARKLVEAAIATTTDSRVRDHAENATQAAANWQQRALNAEGGLTAAYREIEQQRNVMADLLGRIRDLEGDLPEDSLQRLITENTSLKQQINNLAQESRRLQDRLHGARDNNRFLDTRIAALEAEILTKRANE